MPDPLITIGEMAHRAGVAVSAVRFYESRGLLASVRSAGNQRRFPRSQIRRLAFILIAQQLGLELTEIAAELARLPVERAPSREEWAQIGERLRGRIDVRIARLEQVRDRLGGCIGCGCLSLDRCALYNPGDRAARGGAGPRFLLGDRASDFA